MTSDTLPSSADTSPDGAYTTDSGISESCSHYPSEEVSDSATSVNSDNVRGTSVKNNTVMSDKYHRPSSNDSVLLNDDFSRSTLKPEKCNGIEEKPRFSPFVNVHEDVSKRAVSNEKDLPVNSNYVNALRSMIAQNMMQPDHVSSQTPFFTPDTVKNPAFPLYGHNQWNGALQNALMNPFHILTKLIQDSVKSNEEKFRNDVPEDARDANNLRIPNVQSSMEFLGKQLLFEKTNPSKDLSFSENSIKDRNVSKQREIESSSSVSNSKEKDKDVKNPALLPFMPLKIESTLEKYRPTTTQQKSRENFSFTSDPKRNRGEEAERSLDMVRTQSQRFEETHKSPTAHYTSLPKCSVPSVNSTSESFSSNITRSRSSDAQRQSVKPDAIISTKDRNGSNTPERQRRSPYVNSSVSPNASHNRHSERLDRDLRVRNSSKLMSTYPYPAVMTGQHQAYPLPIARIGDFPPVPAPPYYNPWSVMYPTYPHAMDALTPHPFLPQFGSEALRIPNNALPKSPTVISPAEPPPTSDFQSTKKSFSRSKHQSNNPIDSLHAAIVREAKEMNKGMDPENMYIECPICHKRIKRLYHFQRHMRIHSGEKSHTCPFCPYKSVRKDNLKSHMKTHEKSKYDGSRRSQSRRENVASASVKSDFLLSPESAKRASSPLSPPSSAGSLPFLQFPSTKPIEPSSSPSYISQRKSPFSASPIDRSMDDMNHQNLTFPLLPTTRYYSNNKLAIPYNPYPSVSQFLPFATHERENYKKSSASITEIIDDNPSSPKSRKPTWKEKKTSQDDQEINAEKQSFKRHSVSPSETDAKRPRKSSVENGEELLLGNSNNSNNLEMEPLGIFSPEVKEAIRHQHASKLQAWEQTNPRKREDQLCGMTDSPTGTCTAMKTKRDHVRGQNGEQTHIHHLTQGLGFPNSRTLGLESGNGAGAGDIHDDEYDTTDVPRDQRQRANSVASSASVNSSPMVIDEESRIQHALKTENVAQIEGKFLSFIDMRSKHLTSEGSRISSGRASSSSLESAASKIEMKDEPTPLKDSVKPDAMNASTWASMPRESKCRLCDFVASNNPALQEHMSTHKEDGQYKCPQCDYHGKNLSKLIEHIRIHTGERPFQCDQCSYAAKRKDNLAQHKSVKHDKNRFKGPTRVLKLSTQQDFKRDVLRKTPPMLSHPEYASILLGQNPFCVQDIRYFKGLNTREAERFSYFPGDWFAKLRELPFHGHKPFSDLITEKNSVNFGQNFLNGASGARTPSHASLSSSTTI